MKILLTVIFSTILSALPLAGQAFDLVANGKALATIVVPENPDDEELQAARVIEKYVKQMSGVTLLIKKASQNQQGNLLLVGKVKNIPRPIVKKLHLGDSKINFFSSLNDAFMILSHGTDKLYVIGHRSRGTLFAAYELLQQLGCRFYFGSRVGIVVPERRKLSLKAEQQQFFKPDFTHRVHYSWGVRGERVRQQEKEFKVANCLNNEMSGFSGHNFARIWPKKKYPELFPNVKAVVQDINIEDTNAKKRKKRKKFIPYQVCASNPKAAEIGAAWAIKQMKKNPKWDVVTFFVNDGGGGDCLCENCNKLGNNADRYVYLINKIGEKFFAKYPDKHLVITSYANCAQIPHRKIKGFDNNSDKVIVMMYEFFSKTPINELFAGWAKASHGLLTTMSSYFYHPNYGMLIKPRFSNKMFMKIIARKNSNLKLIRMQAPADWIINGLNRYIAARLMWDTKTDIEAVKRDFAENMFPSASNEFYNFISAAQRSSLHKMSVDDFVIFAHKMLDNIYPKLKTADEKFRWEAYAAWLYLLKTVQQLGDNDRGVPPKKVISRQKRFIEIIKGIAKYDVVEYRMRTWNHAVILQRYGKMNIVDARKMVKSIKAQKIDAAFLRREQQAFTRAHPVANGTRAIKLFDTDGNKLPGIGPGISNLVYSNGAFEFDFNSKDELILDIIDKYKHPRYCLFKGKLPPGRNRLYWNGSTLNGKPLPSGEYTVRARLGGTLQKDKTFGDKGFVQFENPVNLVITPDDIIYVAEKLGREVIKLSVDGKQRKVFPGKVDKNGPLCVGENNNLYCLNRGKLTEYSLAGKTLNEYKIIPRRKVHGLVIDKQGIVWTRQTRKAVMTMINDKGKNIKYQVIDKIWALPPIHGVYVGQSLASDRQGSFYTTDCFSAGPYYGALRKTLIQNGKLVKSYSCTKRFLESIGVTVAPNGLIYAIERGTVSDYNLRRHKIKPSLSGAILQFYDNGSVLQLSGRYHWKEIQGGRAIAVDSVGDIYVLEDKQDFHKKTQSLLGRGRLFKYKFKYATEKYFSIKI